jgi:lsr operon transcriptional repressor
LTTILITISRINFKLIICNKKKHLFKRRCIILTQEVYADPLATKVAWYYYKENLTQTEIAEIMGLNRIKVVRLLEKARIDNIVQFHIKGIEVNCLEFKKALIKQYNLDDAIIVPTPKNKKEIRFTLAKAAAQLLQDVIMDNELVGVGWGVAVSYTLNNLNVESSRNISVVTLTGGVNNYIQKHNSGINQGFNGPIYAIPSPFITSTEQIAEQFLTEPSVKEILELALLSKYTIVGIGGLSQEATIFQENKLTLNEITNITNLNGVGDILGQFYDINGNILDIPLHKRIIGTHLSKLKEMNVIAVAGGQEKVRAIYGALKGGYISTLITDEETAEQLITFKGE